MGVLRAVWVLLRGLLASRTTLTAENLALRQQINVLQRSVKRPKPRNRHRIFWVWLSKLWPGWRSALTIVQPSTVRLADAQAARRGRSSMPEVL